MPTLKHPIQPGDYNKDIKLALYKNELLIKHINELQNYWWGSAQASNKRSLSFKTGLEPSHSSFSSFLSHPRNITGPNVDGTCSYKMLHELHFCLVWHFWCSILMLYWNGTLSGHLCYCLSSTRPEKGSPETRSLQEKSS